MREIELLELQKKLERDQIPHAIATVVNVRGSASAKAGSKMLISAEGKNLWGWVGGGCAESFTIAQALESLSEARPRTIQADLDDEVFGLGMPCGGVMEIFIEPKLAPTQLKFQHGSENLRQLADHFGFQALIESTITQTNAEALSMLALALQKSRGLGLKALAGELWAGKKQAPSEFLLLGHSRITEELAKLGALLEWPTRVYGLHLNRAAYPKVVSAQEAQPDYAGLEIKTGSFVVIASHHKGDHEYARAALSAGASYVGLIASRKRAGLVLDHLRALKISGLENIRAPAGLDLGCRNPAEIALSVVAELL
jgi:xanthine/CO dehydrogenase XdhC/CoxF family maturation factor